MALVNVTNVVVLDNPTTFTNPLTFEVTFECLQELDADLEWKVIYVGSAEDERFDQVLEEVDVGPIPVGVNKFVLTAESPDPATIPPTDLVGVTVTLITCCYKSKEFIRVGYYVNNEHMDPAINAEIQEGRIPPAETLDPASISRNILADKPRVTRFPIDWNAAPGDSGKVAAESEEAGSGVEAAAMDEAAMEDDEDMLVVGAEGEGGVGMDEEMGGGAEGEGGEGSDSMGSEGEADGDDDRSVDLEEEERSGDAEGEADMDADSSGAEDMEDVTGDAVRAANSVLSSSSATTDAGVGASTISSGPTTGGLTSAPAVAGTSAGPMPGVLAPAPRGDENIQLESVQNSTSNGSPGAAAGAVGQANCGNGGIGQAVANTKGGKLLF